MATSSILCRLPNRSSQTRAIRGQRSPASPQIRADRSKTCVFPPAVAVTVLADRGFGDVKLFAFLANFGFDYAIRFCGNIHVAAADGQTRLAADWVGVTGRARKLRDTEITAARHKVAAVVCVHAKDMKEPWCIATSHGNATAREIINSYAKRWTIEPGFRDSKTLRFGMAMSALCISDPQRRDRLLFFLVRLRLSSLPSSAPPAKVSAWIGFSSPTPPSAEPTHCSARLASSTTSSPTCPTSGCAPSSKNTLSY